MSSIPSPYSPPKPNLAFTTEGNTRTPTAFCARSRAPPIWFTKLWSVALASILISAAEAAPPREGRATMAGVAIRMRATARTVFMTRTPKSELGQYETRLKWLNQDEDARQADLHRSSAI